MNMLSAEIAHRVVQVNGNGYTLREATLSKLFCHPNSEEMKSSLGNVLGEAQRWDGKGVGAVVLICFIYRLELLFERFFLF